MGKSALIHTSDSHTNSTVGLTAPTVNLDDGGTYRASRGQRWLYGAWREFWQQVRTDTQGYRRIHEAGGDIGELDTKRRSNQIITANKATIQRMIFDTYEVPWSLVDAVYIIRGTPAHTGKSSWLEEAIAKDLDHAVPESEGIASWYHLRAELEHVKFDIAHHASMGRLPWTEANAANKLARIAQVRYWEQGEKAPDVMIRAHNHRYADSGGNYSTFAVLSQCWSLMTEYGYRIGAENTMPNIGGLVFLCEDGEYTMKRYDFKINPGRRLWRLKM